MTLQFLRVPSSEQQTPNIRMPISDKPTQPGTPSLTLNWQVLCFLSRECTYPSSVSHLQMFFICPLLQHLLGCPDILRSHKSWEKNRSHPKPWKGFYLQNQPWSTFTAGRQRQQHEAMRSIQSSSPQETSLRLINILFFFTHLINFIHNFASVIFPLRGLSRLNNPSLLDFSLWHSCSTSP